MGIELRCLMILATAKVAGLYMLMTTPGARINIWMYSSLCRS